MADLLRRYFSPETKLSILKKHLVDKIPVSQVCDEHRIQVSLFYLWQKQLFENGHSAFENGRGQKRTDDAKQKKIDTLEAKVQRKDSVIAELMEEHVQLKKELGDA
jgi:transposase-like protein